MENLIARDPKLCARQIGPDRTTAGGDQDMFGGFLRAIGQLNRMRISKLCALVIGCHTIIGQNVTINTFEAIQFGVQL